MARITLITSGPLSRAPRVHKEASTLAGAGHAVRVVGVAYHQRFEALDERILRTAGFRKAAVDRRPGRAPLRSIGERALTHLSRRACWQHPVALGPYHALRKLALAEPYDLLIAHTELPLCIAANLPSTMPPVATDIEDWHSQDLLPSAQYSRPLALLRRVERTLLHRSAHVTTTSRAMAKALARAYSAPEPVTIPNTFPLSPPPPARTTGASPGFVWISQTVGPGRGLEEFLRGWAATRTHSRVLLLGDISPGFDSTLRALLPDSHRDRLEFRPLVPPNEIAAELAPHWIGLALEPSRPPNKNLTISNKIFHYLDAGLALLATPTAGQREILGTGVEIGLIDDLSDSRGLTQRLEDWLKMPRLIEAQQRNARKLAEEQYCWEKTAPRLLETVTDSLNRGVR